MSNETKQAEAVDHRAEAELAVAQAGQYFGDEADSTCVAAAAIGQVHASLAIADQLERLNETLSGADLDGRLSGFLDNLTTQISEIIWRNTGGGK